MSKKEKAGTIGWIDLTVPDAVAIRDFYKNVTGWNSSPVSMGDYNDFNMTPPLRKEPAAGICHARGMNKDLPSQWLIYINVEDLDESLKNCKTLGGKIISEIREMSGHGRYCVIQDPSGAVAALFEPSE